MSFYHVIPEKNEVELCSLPPTILDFLIDAHSITNAHRFPGLGDRGG